MGEGGAEGLRSAGGWCLLDKSLGQIVVRLREVWEVDAGEGLVGFKLFLTSCSCMPQSKIRSMVCMSILQ